MDRRTLLRGGLATVAAGALPRVGFGAPLQSAAAPAPAGVPVAPCPSPPALPPLRPPRLAEGDLVALVGPANATFYEAQLDVARETLEALGLRVRVGEHLLARYGSLAGRDAERAADLNAAFADPEVRAVIPIRGGWGSARLLPHLDFAALARDPKVILGFSDVTALLLAARARSGVVTFHGPNGLGRWDRFSADHVRRLLFAGEAPTLVNKVDEDPDRLVPIAHRIRTITPGRARGRLVGGNLTVLTALVGTPYLPSFDGAILFLEDTNEQIYRVDRMMNQLALAGLLGRIAGFFFGTCEDCGPGEGYGSLTLEEVLADHVGRLGVPAWQGAMVGHGMPQWTLPVGVEVEVDAGAGTVRMLEAGVV